MSRGMPLRALFGLLLCAGCAPLSGLVSGASFRRGSVSSASFATPIGYQTNTFVYTAGGYRFIDFVKIGLPLSVILWLTATIVIPLYWPLS